MILHPSTIVRRVRAVKFTHRTRRLLYYSNGQHVSDYHYVVPVERSSLLFRRRVEILREKASKFVFLQVENVSL